MVSKSELPMLMVKAWVGEKVERVEPDSALRFIVRCLRALTRRVR